MLKKYDENQLKWKLYKQRWSMEKVEKYLKLMKKYEKKKTDSKKK